LERWYLDRPAFNGRLLISIFFLYDFSAGTISDVTARRKHGSIKKSGSRKY